MFKTIKEHKWKAIISSLIPLIPMAVGFLLWDQLPNSMTIHWGADGIADGMGPKLFAVVGLPLIMLILHWVCILITCADPGNKNQTRKATGLIFWILPLCSLFILGIVYSSALGHDFSVTFVPASLGVLFLIFGNYMPKIKQNHTLGIKVTWTVHDEANWNATHRFAGRVWMIGGLVLLLSIFLPAEAFFTVMIVVILVVAVAPFLYSYLFYRNQLKEGTYTGYPSPKFKSQKKITWISLILVVLILAAVAVLMFTGNIQYRVGDETLSIEASYWGDMTVRYEEFDRVEYRDTIGSGMRTNGFGSPRLAMGTFQNDEFGSYTRYTYTQTDAYIVLYSGERVLVLNSKTEADTQALYEQLQSKIE